MASYVQKRGDTLSLSLTLPAAYVDGYFVDWTVTSQIRTPSGRLISDLVVTWANPATTRTLVLKDSSTANYPIGTANIDVQFVRNSDSFTLSTETIEVDVQRDVTIPA